MFNGCKCLKKDNIKINSSETKILEQMKNL